MLDSKIDIDEILEIADGGNTVRARDLLCLIDTDVTVDYLEDHGYIMDEEKYNVDDAIYFLEEEGYIVIENGKALSFTELLCAGAQELMTSKPMEAKKLLCDMFGLTYHATAEEVADAMKNSLNWK